MKLTAQEAADDAWYRLVIEARDHQEALQRFDAFVRAIDAHARRTFGPAATITQTGIIQESML